jgi:tRNA pseudouridine38-40 synthase
VKTLNEIRVWREGERDHRHLPGAELHPTGRSAPWSAALVEVGRGKQPVGWIADILAAADRTQCGPIAPPDGLYLTHVDYD